MREMQLIQQVMEDKGGIMKTADFVALGINNSEIIRLWEKGELLKVKHGYYRLAEYGAPRATEIIAHLFPDGILSMDTALYFYGYRNGPPQEWVLTLNRNIARSRLKLDYPTLKIYLVEEKYLNVGVSKVKINGTPMKMYNRERVICDCFRYRNKIQPETFNYAIKMYMADPRKNSKNLPEYAKDLRIYNRIKDVLGVLC